MTSNYNVLIDGNIDIDGVIKVGYRTLIIMEY